MQYDWSSMLLQICSTQWFNCELKIQFLFEQSEWDAYNGGFRLVQMYCSHLLFAGLIKQTIPDLSMEQADKLRIYSQYSGLAVHPEFNYPIQSKLVSHY